jgi:hypothetical protein
MTVSTWPGVTDAILAALDGWTLVPVDTVADAEALVRLRAELPVGMTAAVCTESWRFMGGWLLQTWPTGTDTPASQHKGDSIAAAVRAALGASDDE